MLLQIVDDNEKFRRTLRKFILPLTQDIIECNNGSDAIDTYTKFLPDLVLMDIKMPVMDGLISTKNIIERFPNARIVLISDFEKQSFHKAALESGALAFFSKEDLLKVREFISNEVLNNENG